MRYGMVIDLKRCMGCQTCATSCKLANNLPAKIWWNTVYTDGMDTIDTAAGEYPNGLALQHWPVACQHCANPSCLEVCPTGATWKDEETGIVMVDSETCIGCESCMGACPYGVRSHLKGEPVYALEFAVGYADAPAHVAETVEKCTLCKNLVDQGKNPTCVDACVGYARFFGDLDEPESEGAKMIASDDREVIQLLAEQGTDPSVYYLK